MLICIFSTFQFLSVLPSPMVNPNQSIALEGPYRVFQVKLTKIKTNKQTKTQNTPIQNTAAFFSSFWWVK